MAELLGVYPKGDIAHERLSPAAVPFLSPSQRPGCRGFTGLPHCFHDTRQAGRRLSRHLPARRRLLPRLQDSARSYHVDTRVPAQFHALHIIGPDFGPLLERRA